MKVKLQSWWITSLSFCTRFEVIVCLPPKNKVNIKENRILQKVWKRIYRKFLRMIDLDHDCPSDVGVGSPCSLSTSVINDQVPVSLHHQSVRLRSFLKCIAGPGRSIVCIVNDEVPIILHDHSSWLYSLHASVRCPYGISRYPMESLVKDEVTVLLHHSVVSVSRLKVLTGSQSMSVSQGVSFAHCQ